MKTLFFAMLLPVSAWAVCPSPSPCLEISSEFQEQFSPREKDTQDVAVLEDNEIDIATYAKGFLGTPYLYGGETANGIDCSSYMQTVFKEFNIHLPRTSRQQFSSSHLEDVSIDGLSPYDLLFFKAQEGSEIDHVALYLGDGKMIHSSKKEGGVEITDFKFSKFWSSRYVGARRIRNLKEKL